jgi:dephospho-CoA kinase
MKLIGLAGRARSGKSSITNHLVNEYGYQQLAFADPIRDTLEYVFDVPHQYREIVKESGIPPHGKSYRELAQTLGDWGRGLRTDFWILELERRLDLIKRGLGDDICVVISDVRYLNEAFWVRQRGTLWHIVRPDQDPAQTRAHSSEAGIEPLGGEAIIQNIGELADLLHCVDRILP